MSWTRPSPLDQDTEHALTAYLDGQLCVEHLRRTEPPESPWPGSTNPMLKYLLEQATKITTTDGDTEALVWLAVHCWFESAIESAARAAYTADGTDSFPHPSHS